MKWKYIFLNNTMVCVTYVKPVTVLLVIVIILFPNKRDKLELNRHNFLVLYFCVANLSYRIFTVKLNVVGKMFAVINFCGNLFLWIAGNITKIRTRKNFMPHGNN